MQIANNCVVTLDYTLQLENGELVDSSEGEPFSYLQGHGNIVPGLERQMAGLAKGDQRTITVAPDEAYGPHDTEEVQKVPKARFDGEALVEGEMVFAVDDEENEIAGRIVKIEGEDVTVDFNHPLAGKTLKFAVTVRDVREATSEEITHGHLHGEEEEGCCGGGHGGGGDGGCGGCGGGCNC